jgi:molybdenum cofactor cytidylyltransferase
VLAAVILAAGESRRMGQPKALLPFPMSEATPGKLTFLDHLISIARHPRIGTLRIVLGAHAERIEQRLKLAPESVVLNPDWAEGQLSSIQAALRNLTKAETEGAMFFLVDHPLVSTRIVGSLIDAFYATRAPIVLPTHKGRRGHPVIFSRSLFAELLAAPADVGARAVVWAHADEVKEVPTDEEGIILNLNDPASLRNALGKP